MNLLPRSAAAFALTLALVACSSGTSPVGTDSKDSGVRDGTTVDSGKTKHDGGSGTGSGSGSGDAGCHGAPATWKTLTTGPIACSKNSDCCVIVNECLTQSQIVSASNEVAAKTAWPYCAADCTLCMVPLVGVFCDNGTCAGTDFGPVIGGPGDGGGIEGSYCADGGTSCLSVDHCGVDGPHATPDTTLNFVCSATYSTGSSSGSGTGSSTGSGTGSSSGTGTGSGSGSSSGCTGDEATWTSLTSGTITCTENSDCCVIVNDCTYEAQIVSATNETAAEAAWPTCQSQCTHCVSPAVYVGCYNGVCGGNVVSMESDGGMSLMGTHCGTNPTPPTGSPAGSHHFTCGEAPTGSGSGS